MFIFLPLPLGHCRNEAEPRARLSPRPRIVTPLFPRFSFSCSLCSAGAHKSRRRPLKRDHSRGSSQQAPHPLPPLPLSKTSPGLDGAARGHAAKLQLPGAPSDAASDVGNASHPTPLPPHRLILPHPPEPEQFRPQMPEVWGESPLHPLPPPPDQNQTHPCLLSHI